MLPNPIPNPIYIETLRINNVVHFIHQNEKFFIPNSSDKYDYIFPSDNPLISHLFLINDKNIINLPNPFRYILAKLISKLRKKGARRGLKKATCVVELSEESTNTHGHCTNLSKKPA